MIEYRNHRGEEVVSERRRRMVFSTGMLQYSDGNGWYDIDTTLRSIGSDYWFMCKAPYACYIPKRADTGIRFENDQHGFSWIPECQPVEGELIDNNVAFYKNAFADGVHLKLFAGNNNFTKLIIIEKPPVTIPDYLEFKFRMPYDNLSALHNDMRELQLGQLDWVRGLMKLSENTESASYIWQARVFDETGRSIPISLGFEIRNGDMYMIKRISREVLESFAYPIMTDASSSFIAGTGDGYVTLYGAGSWTSGHDAASGSSADYTSGSCFAGSFSASPITFSRAFFPFNTTGLPLNAQALSGSFVVRLMQGIEYGYLRMTECFQASNTQLVTGDYEDNGYDSGYEQAARAKYEPTVAGAADKSCIGGQCTFTLDTTGCNWIKSDTSTWTKLGIRSRYDCEDVRGSAYYSIYTSNDSNSAYHPKLSIEYQVDYVHQDPTGYLGWGGTITPSIETKTTGAGGIGIGGTATIVRPVSYDTSYAVSLASDIKGISSAVASSTKLSHTINDAVINYKRPYLKWMSMTSAEVNISIVWEEPIDTILLYNCNFTQFSIEVTNITGGFLTIQDPNTGFYNGIVRINKTPSGIYAPNTNYAKIIIPSQSRTDGAAYYSIGSIVGAIRNQLATPPKYPFKKEFIEPIRRLDFEGGSWETRKAGNNYHMLEYNWDAVSPTDFNTIRDVVCEADITGAVIVHERWSDYEAIYLGSFVGDFDYIEYRNRYSTQLVIREYN